MVKPVTDHPRLIWTNIVSPADIKEEEFPGTLEAAEQFLQEKANSEPNLFGQVLHGDGKVYANIASPIKR
jgi:hypothetical protein